MKELNFQLMITNQLLYHLTNSALVVALGNAPSESEDNGFTVRFASLTRYATNGEQDRI